MKIVSATYAGLERPFTKVKVAVQFEDGTVDEGTILFENEGRDIDFEGFKDGDRVSEAFPDLDEADWDKIEKPVKEGMVEYDAVVGH